MSVIVDRTHTDLSKLIDMVQGGEEVLITSEGRPVAKIVGVRQPDSTLDRSAWIAERADLRRRIATGKPGCTVDQILDEDRNR